MYEFKYLERRGEISIKPVKAGERIPGLSFLILLMGPTGAGKSSFIEALAGPSQSLSISKNQLAGYTQAVTAYEVVNANCRTWISGDMPLYLIDTPGFADSTISEKGIIDMVGRWMEARNLRVPFVKRIFYFMPINETRLAGTKRKTIDMMIQILLGKGGHTCLTFVTTMWDTLHNERTQNRGESNFAELRDKQLKQLHKYRFGMERFMNTQCSAMEIIDLATSTREITEEFWSNNEIMQLYRDLHERIEKGFKTKRNIEEDLAQDDTQANLELKDIQERNLREIHEALSEYIRQFFEFGNYPEGYKDAVECLRQDIYVELDREQHPCLPTTFKDIMKERHRYALLYPHRSGHPPWPWFWN